MRTTGPWNLRAHPLPSPQRPARRQASRKHTASLCFPSCLQSSNRHGHRGAWGNIKIRGKGAAAAGQSMF